MAAVVGFQAGVPSLCDSWQRRQIDPNQHGRFSSKRHRAGDQGYPRLSSTNRSYALSVLTQLRGFG